MIQIASDIFLGADEVRISKGKYKAINFHKYAKK